MPDVIQIAIQAVDSASKVIGGVGDSLDRLGKQSDDADKKLKLFGLSTEQIGAKMTQAGKIATVGLTLPIAGLAVAATKAASDLNETMNKVDVLFGDQANAIKKWSETSVTAFGQSKQHALDSSATFAMFAKSAGLAGNEVTEFAKKNTVLASDLASFNNTSPQEAFEAIGSALRGETEPIRRYNVLINEATLKDEALRQGLIKTTTEALTPQQKILATSALIFKQTSAAQGDYAKTADGVANATRTLNEQFQDVLASLGQALLPTVQKAVGVANNLLAAFNNLDQPQKDLIVGFGLMAAAAGPVLTIGGKLVSVFGSIGSVALDAAGGFIRISKDVGDTAKYLKEAGVSVDTLKFAFQNLKASGALLGVELGVIIAGLIAIAKYLGEVDAASKATTEDLLKMAHSGDVFKQAAATTEILAHSQDRLKAALDGTHEKIRIGARDYADYKSSIEATAKAAGYEINAAGDLVQVYYGLSGRTEKLIESNYRLSESGYKANQVSRTQAYGIDLLSNAMLGASKASGEVQVKMSNAFTGTSKQIEELKKLTDEYNNSAQAEKDFQKIQQDAIENIKAQNGAISDAYSMAIQYTESQRKQADVQKELDDLNAKITARGPVHAAIVKNEKLSAEELTRAQLELKVAQEDLTSVQRKGGETDAEFALRLDTLRGKVTDYSAKLGEHTVTVGGATKAELEQKAALEGQIAALQKADEVTRAKGAFDALTKSFRDGVLTQDQFKERAGALNAITGLYTKSALEQATAQEILMQAFADPRSEAWRAQLIKNEEAIDGQIGKTENLAQSTKNAQEAITKAGLKVEVPITPKTDEASKTAFQQAAQGYVPRAIEIPIKPKVDPADKTKIGHDLAGDLKYAQPVITPRVDAAQATKDIQAFTTDKIGAVPAEKKTVFNVDTLKATNDTQKVLTLFGLVPKSKDTSVNVDAKFALQILDDIVGLFDRIKDKAVTVKVNYERSGTPPEGFQHGGSYVVPPNPSGSLGDYFPVLAAPGERVTVQTRAQQNAAHAETRIAGGDTYIYNTNVYNPLAAAMLADQQRRERVARSNARMGVT